MMMRWIRPIISLEFSTGIIYGFVVGKINAEQFLLVAGGAIAWWYVDRQKTKNTQATVDIANANAQAVIAQAIDTKGQT